MTPFIHIFGASGSGVSTLGRALSEALGFRFMDTDSYYWLPTDPPFREKRPVEERLRMIREDRDTSGGGVLSGDCIGWGDVLIPEFTLVIRLETDTAIRLQRIRNRESERFGGRILPGGDMYEQHLSFLEWAGKYDTADTSMRSFQSHEEWQQKLTSDVLRLRGEDPVQDNVERVLRKLAECGKSAEEACGQEGAKMNYRVLGKTGLSVSEIGFGGEWLERHPEEESVELIRYAGGKGINIIDCWMADPKSRDIIGKAIHGNREKWYVQGHIGSTWQDGQYVRTRDMMFVKPAFEDLLKRLQSDYVDLGMIHYVDTRKDWEDLQENGFLDYVLSLKAEGKIRHIGLSTHNPEIGKKAAESGFVEMILFSINPAFDMLPSSENIYDLFAEKYDESLSGTDPVRADFYRCCVENDIGLTVMKPFAGGRLFKAETSPFGVGLSPVKLIHYALTRPAVAAVMCGYDTKEQIDEAVSYETADAEARDYASVIAGAPLHSAKGQCTYCGHCKPCPAELDIAMINKYYDLSVMQEKVPESLRQHYLSLEHTASECLHCQSCESRCPFGVGISARMEKAEALFGR